MASRPLLVSSPDYLHVIEQPESGYRKNMIVYHFSKELQHGGEEGGAGREKEGNG